MIEKREGADLAPQFASEKHVGRCRQVVGESQVLIDHLDPDGAGIDRLGEVNLPILEQDPAMRRREVARDDLHQRRLAGAVVAHEADDLAGLDREIDVGQGADGAEFLPDILQDEERHVSSLPIIQNGPVLSRVLTMLKLVRPIQASIGIRPE